MKKKPTQNSMSHANMDDSHEDNSSLKRPESSVLSRRRFLEAAGFTVSLVALNGCSRPSPEKALPFVEHPEGTIPGQSLTYSSTCAGCPAGCGLHVSVRDGRPLKMEGMPDHPFSNGGLCAVGQAQPMGLYDSHRLQHPLQHGKTSDWTTVDKAITDTLQNIRSSDGAVRFVTSTITSPTQQAAINSFLKQFTDGRHIMFDSVSCSAILDAHEKTHGVRLLPHFLFDRANVIVSFGADFLGTWISPVEYTTAWQSRRVPTESAADMSYHVQFEGQVSLTGTNADRRFRLAPDEYGAVLNNLYGMIASRTGTDPLAEQFADSPIPNTDLTALAERLWDARGKSLVLCDSQDISVQLLVNGINHLLGNYGETLDIAHPSRQRLGNDRDVLNLVKELKDGTISALFVAGTDLTHNLPARAELSEAISKVSLVVSLAERENDFAALAHFVCPDHHALEGWMDSEPINGVVSLSQPLIQPIGETRSIIESLARWSGNGGIAYDIIRSVWEKHILPRAQRDSFRDFWDQSVSDGFARVSPVPIELSEFNSEAVRHIIAPKADDELCLVLYSRIGMTDSRHAHNPWLQELPDPVTKITWDNYVAISPVTAGKLKLVDGEVVRLTMTGVDSSLELPVLIQRGQHDRVISIALGFGVKGTDRFASIGPEWLESRPTVVEGGLVGKNAADLIDTSNGTISLFRSNVTLDKTGLRHDLASTQEHHSLDLPPNVAPHGAEVRDVVQHTTLAAFAANPEAGKVEHHFGANAQLWSSDHPKEGHRWGMTIDLNSCTGCSACLIACQSENNVPVVGKDEVRRQREMHWIRIDRYFSGDDDDVSTSHQPMMCQHCDNAPCETVCPVLATVHNDEGLNEQVYNRCVGTRYCANNCPYKVRRFNWFDYPKDDPLANLALNPDVTVRSRGVMEKCSMCVQRIEEGRIDAKRRGEPLSDGDIQTACQQSCPAQAITFGDLNDTNSAIHQLEVNPRRYGVLEEFNFQQSVSYLRVVRNRDDLPKDGDGHV